MPKKFICGILLTLIGVAAQSCHKESSTTASGLDFTISGNRIIGDTLSFTTTASSASSYHWDFGDSTYSSVANPQHFYTSIRYNSSFVLLPYTVSLTINGDTAHPVSHSLRITPGTTRLAGTWHWTGGRYQYFNPLSGPPVDDHPLSDTVFSIAAPTDTSLTVWGETIGYVPTVNEYFNGYSVHTDGNKITYTNDTIFFLHTHGSLGAAQYYTYHFP